MVEEGFDLCGETDCQLTEVRMLHRVFPSMTGRERVSTRGHPEFQSSERGNIDLTGTSNTTNDNPSI